ncbi:MAG: acylphosphatase [Candidatus Bathyarchaeum sp.]|nr:MAG: acylphosphatase [Candidatus Bathyarchaeum sp.]
MKARAHVFVSGRVQGVFFRVETRHKATKRNVVGWVRNTHDGKVEAIFEGKKEAVEKMIDFCRKGPAAAKVTDVTVQWQTYTGEFRDFKIRRSPLI